MSHVPDQSEGTSPQKLPEYTYVPGVTPHPVSDPSGHAFGLSRPVAVGHPGQGRILYDAGYYWEAHEVWEAEWLAVGRSGPVADWIKGLIKLAACGVKCLERNRAGAIRHARRAEELFRQSALESSNALPAATGEAFVAYSRQLTANPPIATLEQQVQARWGGVPLAERLPEINWPESFQEMENPMFHRILPGWPPDKPAEGAG